MQTAPMKACTACHVAKPATPDNFHAYKRAPDGRRSVCRVCRAADHAAHRDERLTKRRVHYEANKDRLLATVKAAYHADPEKHRLAALERHRRNRDARLIQMKEYRAANLDELNARRRPRARAAFHERYGTDLEFTLKHRLRALLRVTLSRGREGRRMQELLGYTVAELRAHLERQFTQGMDWQRFMAGEIHIDHILPVASFKVTGMDCPEFKACWSLANLQPMWAAENCSKQHRVTTLV